MSDAIGESGARRTLGVSTPWDQTRSGSAGLGRRTLVWAVALGLALSVWTVIAPLGASPDEPSHMLYAWGVATGQDVFVNPPCETTTVACGVTVEVPQGLIPQPSCYAFKIGVSASCQTVTQHVTLDTATVRYPPLYYAVVGMGMRVAHTLGGGVKAVGFAGRAVSVAIVVSLLSPVFALASVRRSSLLPYLVATLTPMTLYMGGTVNPSGVEIAGGISVAACLVMLAHNPHPDRWLVACFVYGMTWLAWSRPLGVLWAVAMLVVTVFYVGASRPSGVRALRETFLGLRPALVSAAVPVIGAAVWFVFAMQGRSGGLRGDNSVPREPLQRLLALPMRWGGILEESIGILGWLETPLPMVVIFAIAGAISVMLLGSGPGDAQDQWRRRVALIYLVVMASGITLLMGYTRFLWQGRYALPVLATFFILFAAPSRHRGLVSTDRLALVAWLASSASALWLAARYIYGMDVGGRYIVPIFSTDARWNPPFGIAGVVILGLVGMASVPVALRLTRANSPQ